MKATSVRRWLAWLLTAAMVISLMPVMAVTVSADTSYRDGSYEGSAAGYGGTVTVVLTIQDNKVTELTSPSHEEESYWTSHNLDSLLTAIKNANSESIVGVDGVDGISRATISSNAVKNATMDALSKAVDSGLFASGEGTEANPYVIETADQLKAFAESVDNGESYAGQFIVLNQDLDISGANWNPIGAEGNASADSAAIFNGSFDGQDHTISGMTIVDNERTEDTNAGLFSVLNNQAAVKNLHLTGVKIDIRAADAVLRAGGIAGDTVSGANTDSGVGTWIDSCSVTGSIHASTDGAKLIFAGGIAGRANIITTITNCWTDVEAEGVSRGGNNSAYAGGILGMSGNNVKVINCAALGNTRGISPKSKNFGGLAGGIAGMFAGKAWNLASSGDVTIGNAGSPHKWGGALFGEITTSGMAKNGSEYQYPDTGALRDFGYYNGSSKLSVESYNDTTGEPEGTAEIETVPVGTGSITNDTVYAASENVKAVSDMTGQDFADTMNANLKAVDTLLKAFGIEGISIREWTAADGKVLPVGGVWVNTEPDASIFQSGTGTAEDPFVIQTADQMRAFAGSLTEGIDYAGYVITLGADIDISGENWNPVGGSEFPFNGTFDGVGHTISGMTEGSAAEARVVDSAENRYMGLFGTLDSEAVVRNLNVVNTAVYLSADRSISVGGIAGLISGKRTETGVTGALIDNVNVSGVVKVTVGGGNVWSAGLVGYQMYGSIINSWTDADVYAEVLEGTAVAEAGGLVALNNRGLVSNCYSLGNTEGKVSRENGAEGAPAVGGLVAVNGGTMANCYSKGNTTGTGLGAVYNGAVTGWITGTGKTYACWYNKEAKMTADGKVLAEPAAVGTKVAAGVNEEGDTYTGGLSDDINGFTASTYASTAEALNARFAAFPADVTAFGLDTAALKNWTFANDLVSFGDSQATVVYKQPEAEIVPEPPLIPEDGTWYGRSEDESSIVKITVQNNEVKETETLAGESSGTAYDEAYQKAVEKATYGDTTDYSAPDAAKFEGGTGTAEDPYRIADEAQLRYVAEALNEDNVWEDVYFLQTADIDVSSKEWLPIGWGIRTLVKDREQQYCLYPFAGHYDGGDYSITGLKIGTAEEPTGDIRAQYLAGLFGIITGDCNDNEARNGRRMAEVKNVHLEDAIINVASRYQNYAGGLMGLAQQGFFVDNCSVTGTVKSSSTDSFARAGGLMAQNIRGLVTDSWTNVEVSASSDLGQVYAGGMYGMDNRTATFNSFAIGNVTADANYANRIHAGGFTGMAGGIHYNCYAAGNVTALQECTDVGGFNGRCAGICVERNCYWNSDAVQKANNTDVAEKLGNGVNVSAHEDNTLIPKTAEELAGQEFADLLNANRANMAAEDEIIRSKLVSDTSSGTLTSPYYYEGDGSDLNEWIVRDGTTVGFEAPEKPVAPDTPEYSDFKDLGENAWYREGVEFVLAKGMMNGMSPTEFEPETSVSRAMIVTILYRLEGSPEAQASSFRDLQAGSWYEAAVNWAASEGIVKGMTPDTFAPNEAITREQIAAILQRYAAFKGVDTTGKADLSGFSDAASISPYAKDSIAWAVQAGLIKGMDDGTVAPRGNATRAQAAVLMQRLCENIVK